MKIKDKEKSTSPGDINHIFRPLFFNEAIDLFWKHCSLAKKSASSSAIGVISEYFFDHNCDRENKERTYELLAKLEDLFRLYIDFHPIYSTCNDISPSQLFFYSWVEPLLNPKLLLNLPQQHPLKQPQFIALSENYQKFQKYNNDVIKFSELIRKEMLDLLELAENKSFQLNPSKPPTYYGKMSAQIMRWRDFYNNEYTKNKDNIEKAIVLYKSWRLIIEAPCEPKRQIPQFNDKLIKFLSIVLKKIPSKESLTTAIEHFTSSPKTLEALTEHCNIGFSCPPTKEQILIRLISTTPQNKLHSLFKNTPLKTSFTCFWGRLKIMNEYIAHNDPDIWLRHKKEEHPQQGATTEMHLYDNGVFWPWLLAERLKWDLTKPCSPISIATLSTKLLLNILAMPDKERHLSKNNIDIKKYANIEELFFYHTKIANNEFKTYIPDNGEIRLIICLLDRFFSSLPEDIQSVYRTISNLMSITLQLQAQRYIRFKNELREIADLITNSFIYSFKEQTISDCKARKLDYKACHQFTLMLRDEFVKINLEQHQGVDGINLAIFMTAFRYKFTKYTKNSYEIFEKIAEQNGFINSNTLTKTDLDFPQIQGYRWRALREYNLFIKANVEGEKQRNKLYANPLNRLEGKIKKYLEFNSNDSGNSTPLKSAFGSDIKKHFLPEVANSYPYNILKYIEKLLSFFGTPIELHPAIKQYLKLDKKIQIEILNQLPKKDDLGRMQ